MNRRQMFGFIGLTVGAAAAPVLAMAARPSPKLSIELLPSAPVGTMFNAVKLDRERWLISGREGYKIT